MRTADTLVRALVIGVGLLAAPSYALDGTKSDDAFAASAAVSPTGSTLVEPSQTGTPVPARAFGGEYGWCGN